MRTHVIRLVLVLASSAVAASGMGQGLDPRLGGRWYVGSQPGIDLDFATVEWFQPLGATQRDLTFMDWHGIVDEEGFLGQNFGGGYRMYLPKWDRMIGFYGYYDIRDTKLDMYHQLSAGFECVGLNWDFRANAYMPVNPDETVLAGNLLSDPIFQGFNIGRTRTTVFQAALPGFDMEFGMPLPTRFGLRAYAGCYGYEQANGPTEYGLKSRLQAQLSDNVSCSFNLADDQIFGRTFSFGLQWYWRGWTPRCAFERHDGYCGTAYERLATPVERQYNIAVAQRVETVFEALTAPPCDPNDDSLPISIRHVDNAAVGSQDLGTFEDPFTSLAAAQNGSTPGDIILVHGDGSFTGMSTGFTLQDQQRLLSAGIDPNSGVPLVHFVTTNELGVIVLPQLSGVVQRITNTAFGSNVITLANSVELSGFDIIDIEDSAIFGNGVTGDFNSNSNCLGISINRNNIFAVNNAFNTGAGIEIIDGSGVLRIGSQDPRDDGSVVPVMGPGSYGNSITGDTPDVGHPDGGILFNKIDVTNQITTTLLIENNFIDDNGDGFFIPVGVNVTADHGITILQQAFADTFVSINNNTITNNGATDGGIPFGDGIHIETIDEQVNPLTVALTFEVTDNFIGGNAVNGVFVGGHGEQDTDRPEIDGRISNNFITGNGTIIGDLAFGDGIHVEAEGVLGNETDGNAQIRLTRTDGIFGNTITFNTLSGIFLSAAGDGNSSIDALIDSNSINNNGNLVGTVVQTALGSGIDIEVSGDGTAGVRRLNANILDNDISFNQFDGIEIDAQGQNGSLVVSVADGGNGGNTIDNNGTAALAVGNGIDLALQNTTTAVLQVQDNVSISNNVQNGVVMVLIDNASLNANFLRNDAINSNGLNGIFLQTNDDSLVAAPNPTSPGLFIDSNLAISNNALHGIRIEGFDDSTITGARITNNTAIDFNGAINAASGLPEGDGISVVMANDSTLARVLGNNLTLGLEIRDNLSISDNFVNGVFVNGQNDSTILGAITGTVTDTSLCVGTQNINRNGTTVTTIITQSFGDGIRIIGQNNSFLEFGNVAGNHTITGNSLVDNELSGIAISALDSSTVSAIVQSNCVDGNTTTAGLLADRNHGIFVETNGAAVLTSASNSLGLLILDNFVHDAGLDGIRVDARSPNQPAQILRNTVTDNGRDGISYNAFADNGGNTILINDNLAVTGNGRNGIVFNADFTGADPSGLSVAEISGNLDVSGNGIGLAGGDGIQVNSRHNNDNFQIDDNLNVDDNGAGLAGDGIVLNLFGSNSDFEIDGNEVDGNFGDGISINRDTTGGANNDGEIARNIVTNNDDNGIHYRTNGANSDVTIGGTSLLDGNTVDDNGFGTGTGHGVFVDVLAGGTTNTVHVDFNTSISGNAVDGVHFDVRGSNNNNDPPNFTVNDNPNINNNGDDGVEFHFFPGANNNTAQICRNGFVGNGDMAIEINDQGVGNTVELCDNTVGAAQGIIITSTDDNAVINVTGNNITGATGDGICVTVSGDNTTTTISDNTSDNNTGNGICYRVLAGANNSDGFINDNTSVSGNSLNGILVDINANTNTLEVNGNGTVGGVSSNGGDGITVTIRAGGDDLVYDVSDNVLDLNGDDGIDFQVLTGANNVDGQLTGNNVTNSTDDGIVYATAGTNGNVLIDANTAGSTGNGNGGDGIAATSTGATNIFDITNNFADANAGNGIAFTAGAGATNNEARVNSNDSVSGNGLDGIHMAINAGPNNNVAFNFQINDNVNVTDNDNHGISFTSSTAGDNVHFQINGNTVDSNNADASLVGDGIHVVLNGDNNDGEINDNLVSNTSGNQINGIFLQINGIGSDVTVDPNTISDQAEDGIHVEIAGNSNNVDVLNNIISGSGAGGVTGDGIHVEISGNGNTLDLVGNDSSNNLIATDDGSDGIQVFVSGDGNSGTFSTNNLADNGDDGIDLEIAGDNNSFNLTDNVSTGNGDDGVLLQILSTGSGFTSVLDGNEASGNTSDGFFVDTAGTNSSLDFVSNTMDNNDTDGLEYSASGSATGTLRIRTSVSIDGNDLFGVHIHLFDSADIDAQVVTNNFTNNTDFGFLADTNDSSAICLQFFDNSASGNNGAGDDYRFEENDTSTFQFESNNFNEALATYPLYTANSQASGTFDFSANGFDGDEDQPNGTCGFGVFP